MSEINIYSCPRTKPSLIRSIMYNSVHHAGEQPNGTEEIV